MKFFLDFLVPENLDSMLFKLCELILPSVHFPGLHDGLILRISLQRKKIHSNMLCYAQKWVIHSYFKFWVFTFWILSPEIKCRVALTKVFLTQIFLLFGQFYVYSRRVCNKRLANWRPITDTLTLNGFARMQSMVLTIGNGQIWLGTPPVVLQFIITIIPVCGLQLPLRESHWFSFQHWENDRMLLTICVFEKF